MQSVSTNLNQVSFPNTLLITILLADIPFQYWCGATAFYSVQRLVYSNSVWLSLPYIVLPFNGLRLHLGDKNPIDTQGGV
jgi:hypothetical protein